MSSNASFRWERVEVTDDYMHSGTNWRQASAVGGIILACAAWVALLMAKTRNSDSGSNSVHPPKIEQPIHHR